MKRYLVIYGADNEMATFEADNPAHAKEQCVDFIDNAMIEINEVLVCIPVDPDEDT